jgi:DNA-directed RNA polymerase specialized sigma24 family protein
MASNSPGPGKAMDSAAQFATTHWSMVVCSQSASPQAREALEALCRAYWPPLYAYVRRRGYRPEEAQDLTQGFFASLLARNDLAQVKPELGRFRTFLLASLKHYLANEWNATLAQKRGGGQRPLPWDEAMERQYQLECKDQSSPELLYERRWACSSKPCSNWARNTPERASKRFSKSSRATCAETQSSFRKRRLLPGWA